MTLTIQQKLTIATGVVGAATVAFGALGPIMTSTEVLIGTVGFGFVSACLGTVGTVLSGQGAQIKAVAAMPGVESIKVNDQANQTLAQVAMDQHVDKVAPTSASMVAVENIAKGS